MTKPDSKQSVQKPLKTLVLMPTEENIGLCANEIIRGGIVAFPTETVYGLGASAFDKSAVEKIYAAKGRPSDNPLIVHICDKAQIKDLVKEIPLKAQRLMDRFMPGAITLVFNKKDNVPDIVTGGLKTVAVRMPSNKIAQEFIKKCGVPLCAPSANKSGLPSCTTAKHVFDDLNGKIGCILDGGECEIGLESTVIDVSGEMPRLLRDGGISIEEIENAVGKIEINKNNDVALSPGMKYKHYSPKAQVYFSAYYEKMEDAIIDAYDKLLQEGKNPVILALSTHKDLYKERNIIEIGSDYSQYAKNLFASLRLADKRKYDVIIAEGVPAEGIGAAIINRLVKSSGGKII